ncbi:MAG: prepilin-type N-terminal cleavage/methylation domain-containing protein [Myxococcales bacterium]|nr:prepilin-type N-terminal cleavage/methylation domain-containing protein [Myxococcales bacterium]
MGRPALAAAGFSLVELMVVVVLIAILSALAIPSMLQAGRERRVQEASTSVVDIFRNARGRAMYRGRAQMVLVRPSGSALRFDVFESANSRCRDGQFGAATGDSPNLTTVIETLDLATTYYARDGINATVTPGSTNRLRVCYTPMGNAFFGTSAYTGVTDTWSNNMADPNVAPAFEIRLFQGAVAGVGGVARRILLPLGGTPRMRQ